MKLSVICCICLASNWIVSAATGEEREFLSLFNGKNFDGWIGGPDRFSIKDGVLLSKKGSRGNMLTEGEYGDFILRFEFQLTPGANNGLGIRVPADGDGSYNGIELQILDDTAEKYRDLKPYQYHGSAYGIAPAERGALQPVGEWNDQEVRCKARQITVILNGKKILDVDLDEVAADGKTIDGLPHPGLNNQVGHIGFLCHDDEVAFRNIRIRDLTSRQESK